jgi:very-short-patch-repair endonuclease/DNA-directed RNA polymerase subunit RPC12/RpoP
MAKYWSKDNKYEPRDVFLSSGKKYKFNCDKCKEKFNMNLDAIKKGSWCPHCKHKTELKLKKWLEAKYVIKTQPRYDWCKSSTTGRHYPFDFSIENLKLIIELDGAQHFQQVSNWKCYKETTKRDVYKMKQAIRNGYTVIRLLQENVYYDQTDWKINLTKAIKKKYYKPSVIFIAECEIYKTHEKLLDNDNAMKTSK